MDVSLVQGLFFQGNMKEKEDGGGRIPRPRNAVFTKETLNREMFPS